MLTPISETPPPKAIRENGLIDVGGWLTCETAVTPAPVGLDSAATRVLEKLDDWAKSANGAANIANDKMRAVRFTDYASRQITESAPSVGV